MYVGSLSHHHCVYVCYRLLLTLGARGYSSLFCFVLLLFCCYLHYTCINLSSILIIDSAGLFDLDMQPSDKRNKLIEIN